MSFASLDRLNATSLNHQQMNKQQQQQEQGNTTKSKDDTIPYYMNRTPPNLELIYTLRGELI